MKITLATKITITRILMVIPAAALYIAAQLADARYHMPLAIAATVVLALLCISDFLDGYVARKTGTVTDLGKFLDPIADKIVIAVVLFIVVCFGDGLDLGGKYPAGAIVLAVLGGLIMTRELVIGMLRCMAARKGMVIPSDLFGKIKTVFLNTGAIVILLAGLHVVFAYIGTVLLYIGAAITFVSGAHYVAKNKSALYETDSSEASPDEDKE